jgi:hypothetical protein
MKDNLKNSIHPPLTKWANEPSLYDLKLDLESSKENNRLQCERINKWNDLKNITGAYKLPKQKNRSSVQPKVIRRQAEWRYPSLSEPFLEKQKLFDAKPHTWEDVASAKQNELLLNYQINNKINKQDFIDEYVRTAVDEGTVVVRVYWDRQTKIETKEVPVYRYLELNSEEEINELTYLVNLKTENNNEYLNLPDDKQASVEYFLETGIPVIAEPTGEFFEEEEEVIVINKPDLKIISTKDLYLDSTAEGKLDKANFVICKYNTSKSELEKDKRYQNIEHINFNKNVLLTSNNRSYNIQNNFKDEARNKVTLYEYWGLYDIHGTGELVPIIASWVDNVIVRMEINPFPDKKHPFIVANYLPKKEEFFGEPDAELLEDNQAIIGALYRGMIDTLGKSANGQQGIEKGVLDAYNKKRFLEGKDYEFNNISGSGIQNSIYMHTYPELPASAYNLVNIQNQDAEALTGIKSFSTGLSGDSYGEVVAGIKGALDASGKREMNILRRLAKGIEDIGRKIVMMNRMFLSEEETIRITNEKFVSIRKEDLGGFFDLEISISTSAVDAQKANDLAFILQTNGPNLDFKTRNEIIASIADLKRMPDIAHTLRNLEPPVDELAQQIQKLEIAKLQKEIEEIDSRIALNRAKAGKENVETQAEMFDLQENISGEKERKDIARTKAQAESNEDYEIIKQVLKPKKEGESLPDISAAIGYKQIKNSLNNYT